MSKFWEIVFCVPLFFRRHVCLSNLSFELPLTAGKTVFSHLKCSSYQISRCVAWWFRYNSKNVLYKLANYNQIPRSTKHSLLCKTCKKLILDFTFLRSPPEQNSIASRGSSSSLTSSGGGTSLADTRLGWSSLFIISTSCCQRFLFREFRSKRHRFSATCSLVI